MIKIIANVCVTHCNILDCAQEQDFIEDWQTAWQIVMDQKMAIACFKEDSDEIVGMNLTYVICKDDNFLEYLKETVKDDHLCCSLFYFVQLF